MKRTMLKRFTPLKARKGLNKISPKTADRNKLWREIVSNLAEQSHYTCEICHKKVGYIGEFGLQGHHVIPRSKGRIDTEDNCLIACHDCHNHDKYARTHGIPITLEEAQAIIARRQAMMDGRK